MNLRRHRAARPLGIALVLAAVVSAGASSQELAGATELLVDVHITGGPSRVVFARALDDTIYVSASQVFALVGVRITRATRGAELEGVLDPDGTLLALHTDERTMVRGGTRRALPPRGAVWVDGDLFVELSVLAALLDVRARFDMAQLTVVLDDAVHLPAVRRAEAARLEARRRDVADAPELLVDVRVERGPAGLVFARALDDTVLVAAEQFLGILEVRVTRTQPDTALAFVLEPAGTRVDVRTDSGVAQRGDARNALPLLGAMWLDGALYVELDLLADLLGIGATANLAELGIAVRGAEHLPAVRRLERARRQELVRAGAGAAPIHAIAIPGRPAWLDGGVLDWSLTVGTLAPAGPGGLDVESGALQLGLGMDLVGGSAIVLHEERWIEGVAGSARRTDLSWTRAWPNEPRLRQVRLGEVIGTGPRPRQVQGAAVTNAPFVRPAAFATDALTGMVTPGWEVELYRQGTLVGFTTADPTGRYAFDVPLSYGANPVDLVAYGPTGEVRRFQRTFQVPFERLAEHQVEYAAGGGACAFDPCDATLNADIRYGITGRLTFRAGSDYFWRDTLGDLWHPYAGATLQATRSLAFFVEAIGNAQVGGRVTYAPTPNLQAELGHTRFTQDSVIAPLVGSTVVDDLSDVTLLYRPDLFQQRAHARVDAARAVGPALRRYAGRLTLTGRLPIARVDAGVRVTRLSVRNAPFVTTTVLSVQALAQLGRLWQPVRQTVARAGVDVDPDSGLTRIFGGVARPLFRDYYLDLGAGWERGVGGIASLTFKAYLPAVRFTSQNRVDDFGATGVQAFEGSMLFEREGRRLAFADGRSVGRAGVSGFVFLDRDGDGAADPDEPPVPGVLVRVGSWVAEADASGRFTVWDVVPFETLVVEVDANSAPDPQWVPAVPRYLVRPDPNRFVPLDLPFVQTAEVAGHVLLEPLGTPLGGVEVLLEPEEGGDPYRVTTFSDGEIYILGVRPGRYRATVSPASLDALGLAVEPATVNVESGVAAVVEGLVIRVRRTGNF